MYFYQEVSTSYIEIILEVLCRRDKEGQGMIFIPDVSLGFLALMEVRFKVTILGPIVFEVNLW